MIVERVSRRSGSLRLRQLTHINVHSANKEPQHSFGGVNKSGFGLPEAGSTGIQFFQDEKAIYIRKRDFASAA